MDNQASSLARSSLLPIVLLCAVSVPAAQQTQEAPEDLTEYGRAARRMNEPSDRGTWDGTWVYVNRDSRVVMWIKTENDVPQVKLRYSSTASPEGFETDWEGNAEYTMRNFPARFSLNFTQRDANRIKGRWEWRLGTERQARIEEADYTLFRTGDGRFMTLDFENFKRVVRSGDEEQVYTAYPAWTFAKASKRLVLWDELPF